MSGTVSATGLIGQTAARAYVVAVNVSFWDRTTSMLDPDLQQRQLAVPDSRPALWMPSSFLHALLGGTKSEFRPFMRISISKNAQCAF